MIYWKKGLRPVDGISDVSGKPTYVEWSLGRQGDKCSLGRVVRKR